MLTTSMYNELNRIKLQFIIVIIINFMYSNEKIIINVTIINFINL
jgi:hypothetical protein